MPNMLADLGFAAILIAFGAAVYTLVASGVSIWLSHNGRSTPHQITRWASSARNATIAIFPLLLGACLIMVAALLQDDYTIAYVSRVTSRETPIALKITSLWGSQAGSLLLWSTILAAFTSLAAWSKRDEKELLPYVLLVTAITQGFFLFLNAFPENPFVRNTLIPPNGNGLSPLLRHPLMIIHPPTLYLGYTGFVIPFAFAMASLMAGRLDDAWIRTTRRWSLAAWLFLSIGLILGGRWAYDVLGWGGYWEWDPVENVAFLPWLTGTAFLHSVMIQEKRQMFKMWNIALIILTYLMVVYGTLIVRTGLLQSVHSFAASDIQWYFFAFTVFMTLFSLYWVSRRYTHLRSDNRLESLLSREAAFLLNNFIILSLWAIIFLFTNFALLSELFTGEEIGVGAASYNAATGPLFAILILLMGVAPLTMWYRTTIRHLTIQTRWPALAATVGVIAIWLAGVRSWGALIGLWPIIFSAILIVLEYVTGVQARVKRHDERWWNAFGKLFERNQRRYGGYLIHLGVIVMAIGVIGTEFFQQQTQKQFVAGERLTYGNYTLEFLGTRTLEMGDGVVAIEAEAALYDRNGRYVTTLTPRSEIFTRTQEGLNVPDSLPTISEDYYIRLVDWEGTSATTAVIRIYVNPLINWLWTGGIIFIIGTLIAAWPDPLDEKLVRAARQRRPQALAGAGD